MAAAPERPALCGPLCLPPRGYPLDFEVVPCLECGGVLKPDVVFFGENVPRPRVEQCYSLVDNAKY